MLAFVFSGEESCELAKYRPIADADFFWCLRSNKGGASIRACLNNNLLASRRKQNDSTSCD
jgi:hypothetical protein